MKIPIMVFMSKIKFNLTLKKSNLPFSFMLLFAIIMFLPTCQLSHHKAYFFPSHFASISSCSACLVGIIWDKNSFVLENEPKCHFNN